MITVFEYFFMNDKIFTVVLFFGSHIFNQFARIRIKTNNNICLNFFQPFTVHLASKYAKSANLKKISFKH
jgi:hypothetical protein